MMLACRSMRPAQRARQLRWISKEKLDKMRKMMKPFDDYPLKSSWRNGQLPAIGSNEFRGIVGRYPKYRWPYAMRDADEFHMKDFFPKILGEEVRTVPEAWKPTYSELDSAEADAEMEERKEQSADDLNPMNRVDDSIEKANSAPRAIKSRPPPFRKMLTFRSMFLDRYQTAGSAADIAKHIMLMSMLRAHRLGRPRAFRFVDPNPGPPVINLRDPETGEPAADRKEYFHIRGADHIWDSIRTGMFGHTLAGELSKEFLWALREWNWLEGYEGHLEHPPEDTFFVHADSFYTPDFAKLSMRDVLHTYPSAIALVCTKLEPGDTAAVVVDPEAEYFQDWVDFQKKYPAVQIVEGDINDKMQHKRIMEMLQPHSNSNAFVWLDFPWDWTTEFTQYILGLFRRYKWTESQFGIAYPLYGEPPKNRPLALFRQVRRLGVQRIQNAELFFGNKRVSDQMGFLGIGGLYGNAHIAQWVNIMQHRLPNFALDLYGHVEGDSFPSGAHHVFNPDNWFEPKTDEHPRFPFNWEPSFGHKTKGKYTEIEKLDRMTSGEYRKFSSKLHRIRRRKANQKNAALEAKMKKDVFREMALIKKKRHAVRGHVEGLVPPIPEGGRDRRLVKNMMDGRMQAWHKVKRGREFTMSRHGRGKFEPIEWTITSRIRLPP